MSTKAGEEDEATVVARAEESETALMPVTTAAAPSVGESGIASHPKDFLWLGR